MHIWANNQKLVFYFLTYFYIIPLCILFSYLKQRALIGPVVHVVSILVSKSTQTHYNYLLSVRTNGREHSLSPRKCQLGRSFLPSLEFASEGHHRFIVRNYAPSFQLLRPMDPRILTLFCIDEGCQPRYVVTLTYLDQKEPDATLPSI